MVPEACFTCGNPCIVVLSVNEFQTPLVDFSLDIMLTCEPAIFQIDILDLRNFQVIILNSLFHLGNYAKLLLAKSCSYLAFQLRNDTVVQPYCL